MSDDGNASEPVSPAWKTTRFNTSTPSHATTSDREVVVDRKRGPRVGSVDLVDPDSGRDRAVVPPRHRCPDQPAAPRDADLPDGLGRHAQPDCLRGRVPATTHGNNTTDGGRWRLMGGGDPAHSRRCSPRDHGRRRRGVHAVSGTGLDSVSRHGSRPQPSHATSRSAAPRLWSRDRESTPTAVRRSGGRRSDGRRSGGRYRH